MWSSLRGSKQLQQQSHNNNHAATRRFPSYFLILIFISIVIYLSYPLMYLSDNDAYQKHTDSVAIVVLGGGLTNDGRVPSHTQLRLDKAVSLYHHTYNKQATIITLSGGTPHKPNPLDSGGFPVWEASAAAKQLLEMGIPASQVFEENFSLDTVGNAYFLRAVHIEPGTFHKLVIITNSWHMPRTKAIFEKVFSLPLKKSQDYPMITWDDFIHWYRSVELLGKHFYCHKAVELEFVSVEAGIADQKILQSRSEREMKSLQSFLHNVAPQWTSFHQLHGWLFTKHNAYASSRFKQQDKNTQVDQEALKSY